jgi:bifunctional UDP-N-acetylglucosamine pyrophosphorylase/glucosamine-1-phosphate N-acetyltransferase
MTSTHSNWTAVILAAGHGTRMRSAKAKVLHELAGRTMIRWVVEAAEEAGVGRVVAVVAPEAHEVRAAAGKDVVFVEQTKRLGTGHALAQARHQAGDAAQLLVLNGDVPLITAETLSRIMIAHDQDGADLTFLTAEMDDAGEYGCVQRDGEGNVLGIVESADRSARLEGPVEINSGQYCFKASWLWDRIQSVPTAPNGEQYITSLVEMAVSEADSLQAIVAEDADEVRGINDQTQLAEAEAILRGRINHGHMVAGVRLIDPSHTYIDAGVKIGSDTVIEPNTQFQGATAIGAGCRIGQGSVIRESTIGDRCEIRSSTIEGATLEADVDVGPYSHMREGAYLSSGVHIGNYAEVKNARLGPGVKMGHFSYIGDAEVGEQTNIGAGTITCNYDGEKKNRTEIGKNVFIGSDTMLVAPVKVGDGARTGAGSVVNHDVPAGALAAGAPARIRQPKEQA